MMEIRIKDRQEKVYNKKEHREKIFLILIFNN